MQNQSPPKDQYQFFDQNRGDAPWLDSHLLPENPYQEQWGNLVDGKVEPHDLSTLLAQLKAGPGALQWNGKPENPPIAFVAAPGEKRMVPVAERQEFKDLILDSHEKFYGSKKKKNGLIFLFLFCICLAMAYGGLGGDAFLPAIFAVISGGAYLESWIALQNLRKSPDEYLAWAVIDNAAHFGGLTFGALFGACVFRSPFGTLPIKNGTWLSIFGLLAEFVFVLVAIATAVILLR